MPTLALIYPLYTNEKLDRNARTIYPLGLAYLAAYAPEDWNVTVIDEQFTAVNYDMAVDLIGITTTTLTATRSYAIADEFRKRGKKVILGGVHASTCPDEALQYADSVCIGDGEHVIANMLQDYARGELKERYSAPPQPLDGLRPPRHDLFPAKYTFLPVSTSRGCPFNCTFCCINEFYMGRYRLRPVEEVIAELKSLPRGYDIVFFTDGNMFGYSKKDAKRFKELCRRMAEERKLGTLPFKYFTCYGSINALADDEALDLAVASGCVAMLVGFESINPESLKSMNKVLNLKYGVDSYFELVLNAQKRGLLVVGEMIVGSDGDDQKALDDTRTFLDKINFDILRLQILQPLPGTKLFGALKEEGRLHLKDFPRDWDRLRDGFLVGVSFDLKQLEATSLQRWVKDTGMAFYAYPRIAVRAMKTLRHSWSPRLAATLVKMNLRSRRTYANLEIA
ncbi:MAG: B12-binding domain-containing radical SAM protein [Candidatus Schekmanbacteria bacterium]|nr:B12-binding domain-containing radical SAM protein [Candidatus Schekmanbacteria bacterium]